MTAAEVHILTGMAEAVRVVKQPDAEHGMVQCRAPGCDNWFHKRSGRHVYCKAADCTYRRGAPPAPELVSPAGGAEELLRRLQESDEAEVGPGLFSARVKALNVALRAQDADAAFGAVIDVGAVCVWWADRMRRGEMPELPTGPPQQQRSPAGLMGAVVASHRRTYALGDQRVALLWQLLGAKELLASTELAMTQTQGRPEEEEARASYRTAKAEVDRVERAIQSVEAAWRERGHTVSELAEAAAAGAPPRVANGGAQHGTTVASERS